MRLEVVNLKVVPLVHYEAGFTNRYTWSPGDLCFVQTRPKCLGTVVAVQDDEQVLVLWSVPPRFNEMEQAANQMACQVRDEIDANIFHDLYAAGMVSKKTVLEKFGLDEPPSDL